VARVAVSAMTATTRRDRSSPAPTVPNLGTIVPNLGTPKRRSDEAD